MWVRATSQCAIDARYSELGLALTSPAANTPPHASSQGPGTGTASVLLSAKTKSHWSKGTCPEEARAETVLIALVVIVVTVMVWAMVRVRVMAPRFLGATVCSE